MTRRTSIDWDAYGWCRAFTNWSLRPENPQQSIERLAAWDAGKMVRRLAGAGADQLVIDARSQWSAHYPTHVFRQADILEGRDLLRELLDAGNAQGIKIVAYLPPGSAGLLTVEHPDWAVRNRKGEPLTFGDTDFYRACHNTSYRQFEIACQQELVRNYPDLAGIWYDGPGYANDCRDADGNLYCYCESCRRKFLDEVGYAMPEDPAWGTRERADLVRWRIKCSSEIVRDYCRAVKAVRPDMPITANVAWTGWRGPGEETCDWLDQISLEIEFYHAPFILSVAKAAAGGDKPVETYAHLNARPGHARQGFQAGLPLAEARYQAHMTMTYGAVPTFTWGNESTASKVFEDMRKRLDACKDTVPMKWCGLIYSQINQYLHDPTFWGHYGKFEAYGCFDLLADEHLPTTIINDRELRQRDLDAYAVIVMPDVAVIDEKTGERLQRFVKNGGGLVTTGYSALRNRDGSQQDNFVLASLFGLTYTGGTIERVQRVPSGYELPIDDPRQQTIPCTLHDHPVCNNPRLRSALMNALANNPPEAPRPSLSYMGTRIPVECTDGTTILASSGNQPLVTVHDFGRGKVVCIASDFGTSYRNDPVEWMHALWGELVRYAAAAPPPIEVDAPSYCKATFYQRQSTCFVHLLSDPYPYGRWPNVLGNSRTFRESMFPLSPVSLRFPSRTFTEATLLPDGRGLRIAETPDGCRVQVPACEGHAIVELTR